eukprot:8113622-Alexandrium_andersonii.AAC.1
MPAHADFIIIGCRRCAANMGTLRQRSPGMPSSPQARRGFIILAASTISERVGMASTNDSEGGGGETQ